MNIKPENKKMSIKPGILNQGGSTQVVKILAIPQLRFQRKPLGVPTQVVKKLLVRVTLG